MQNSKKALLALILLMTVGLSACAIDINVGDKDNTQNSDTETKTTTDKSDKTTEKTDNKTDETTKTDDTKNDNSTTDTATDDQKTTTEDPDTAAIIKAMATKHEVDESEVKIKIEEKSDKHARGTVTFQGAVSGAWWLAAIYEGEWVIAADGNGVVMCEEIDPYGFPTDMVKTCFDSNNKEITRK